MKIKLDIWNKINIANGTTSRLYHEEFTEDELIEIITEKLKEKYDGEIRVEIDEITSR